MSMTIQVTITNDDTGEVEKTFIETVGKRTDSWEAASAIRRLFSRIFGVVFGTDEEWS